MKRSILPICLYMTTIVHAQSTDYYENCIGLEGFELKTALHQLITQGDTGWHYSQLPDFFALTDRDIYYESDSSLLDIYSENPYTEDPYNYWYDIPSLVSGAGTEGLGWNREHIFSQSFFNSYYPLYADLHFILPTDARVNQRRSNLPFGIVSSSPAFLSLNGTKIGPAAMPGYSLNVIEPIDEFKGDIARMFFYIAIRYQELMPYFNYENPRNPFSLRKHSALKSAHNKLLLDWHFMDPVSQKEIDRNNAIFNLQGNRNPFIDHPEWVKSIFDPQPPISTNLFSPIYIDIKVTGKSFCTIEWEDSRHLYHFGYDVYLNDEWIAETDLNEYTFHHLEPNTSYNIKIKSFDKWYQQSDHTSIFNFSTLESDSFSNDLFISKIIEGSGFNKVIELTNKTGYTVSLSNYSLRIRMENEEADVLYWSPNPLLLEGKLEHNKTMIIMHPHALIACPTPYNQPIYSASPAMTFDGTMAVTLRYLDEDIDRIGQSGVRSNYFQNKSLYRKDIFNNPSFYYDSTQWDVHPIDYCLGLGNPPPDTIGFTEIHLLNSEIILYPNPNPGTMVFFKNLNRNKEHHIAIYDITGKFRFNTIIHKNTESKILLPQLENGVYLITIDNFCYKLIIHKQ